MLRTAMLALMASACTAEPPPPKVPPQHQLRTILTSSSAPSCRDLAVAESAQVEEARKPAHVAGYLIAPQCEGPLALSWEGAP